MGASVAAPADYAELDQDYRQYIQRLLSKQGIIPGEVEDAAAHIMLRLIETDILGQFDPEHEITRNGQPVAANFRTFLSSKVTLYAKGLRDKASRNCKREKLMDPTEPSGSWAEVFGGQVWDDYSTLGASEYVARMRAYLASLPRRSKRDQCDLVALFDALVVQGWESGYIDFSAIQAQFKISSTSAYQWVNRLRDILREADKNMAAPPTLRTWNVAGVTLTEADVAEAIGILRDARGIMVKQPLAKAEHPLCHAAEGWYHSFSKAERDAFPELEIDPQTHRKPAGHVKLAVIHRLERMLGGPGEPVSSAGSTPVTSTEPEPDITPAEEFEAELWKLGACPSAVDHITELARMAFTA